MRISVTKAVEFEAAHWLPDYNGDCGRMHGHSYKLEVSVTRFLNLNEGSNMVMDFKRLKGHIKNGILDKWDHQCLNDLPEFEDIPPTAENMVRNIVQVLQGRLQADEETKEVILTRVRLYETSSSYAEWINEIE